MIAGTAALITRATQMMIENRHPIAAHPLFFCCMALLLSRLPAIHIRRILKALFLQKRHQPVQPPAAEAGEAFCVSVSHHDPRD
jgi:hypothetical protein